MNIKLLLKRAGENHLKAGMLNVRAVYNDYDVEITYS